MISEFIVLAALLLAVVFIAAWFLKPGFRQQVEAPKHFFAEQVRQYDDETRSDSEDTPDER